MLEFERELPDGDSVMIRIEGLTDRYGNSNGQKSLPFTIIFVVSIF
jgi:hypothetical protein